MSSYRGNIPFYISPLNISVGFMLGRGEMGGDWEGGGMIGGMIRGEMGGGMVDEG